MRAVLGAGRKEEGEAHDEANQIRGAEMTRDELLEKRQGLEVQRDNAIAQVNFTLGALALVNELLAEMDTQDAPQPTEPKEQTDVH
jgi:hypothetical protein